MLIETAYPLDGLTLRGVRTDSDRPPLLLLHGLTRRWQTFLPLFPALATRWEIHAFDHRGHGGSDRAEGYRVTDYVTDATALLRTHLARPTVLYGHSLGGMTALAVAAEVPELVRAVVLEDPPFETLGRRFHETLWLSNFRGLRRFAGDDRPVGAIVRDLAEVPIGLPGGPTRRLGDLRDATSMRFVAASVKRLDGGALDSLLEGRWLDGYDTARIGSAVRCPVLLLQADAAEGGMLADEDVRLLEATAADVSRVRFPAAGHVLHWQRPEELLRHTTAFLESLDD